MPQLLLPIFPDGVTEITPELAVSKENGRVFYFHGLLPVFSHDTTDVRTFQMITAQFCCNGNAREVDIIRAFGVSPMSVKRAVKKYREHGPAGFYGPRRTRGPAVLTPSVVAQAQQLLDEGNEVTDVAAQLGIKPNTFSKAVHAGRLHVAKRVPGGLSSEVPLSTKSQRSSEDSSAPMGMGATNTVERVAASVGLLNAAQADFRLAADVPNGGVLLGLPAVLAVGLLRHSHKHFELPSGYYGLESILLLLAFMALGRVKSIEALRYCAPGEWGKLLGLDRIPEVRTLRNKIKHLTQTDAPTQWSAELCADWMAAEGAALFYVDGHVRVYSGDKASLPRHFVARQKLCLRASADYWVNALGGQPFFVVHQDVDPHLIKVLQGQIIPRLLEEVPNQPTPEQLAKSPLVHRFTVVFDREGYSPQLLADLRQQRIACLTYHKQPGEDWTLDEFLPYQVTLVSGQEVEMKLAERGVFLSGKVWVREIRRLTRSGHQTSILCTDYGSDTGSVAAAMFARWCQENFFRYMRQEYNLDRLISYGVEDIPDDTRVVNPEHRRLEGEVRKTAAVLTRRRAEFQAQNLDQTTDDQKLAALQQKKGELLEEIARLEARQTDLKQQRKATKKHITVAELPAGERFNRLTRQSKHFVDTIKMIAYRAETAMVNLLREHMSRPEDVRSLLRGIYTNEADLIPDEKMETLTVRIHHSANRSASNAIEHLCRELNETQTLFPGTNLRMVYELVPGLNPGDQEV